MERLSSAIATVGMMIGCLLVGATIQTLQAQTPGDSLDSAIKSAVRAGAFEKAASLLEEAARAGNAVFNAMWTYLGVPCVTLPLLTVGGLPLGVQLIGMRRDEGRLLATARWMEERVAG